MNEKALAESIIERVGGRENIVSAINCMTRLRIIVRDDSAIQEEALKSQEGVLGVVHSQPDYVEVVVGPDKVRKCIAEFRNLGISGSAGESGAEANGEARAAEKTGVLKRMMKTFGQIFAPLIPGIIAAGFCSGIAAIITQAVPGYADQRVLTVIVNLLQGISAAFMTYLTAWAGYRAAKTFGGSPILGGMVGMFTTLSNVDAIATALGLYNDAQPLDAILRAGRGGVLAAVIGVWLMCKIEAWLRRRMPGALDVAVTPLLTLLATIVPYVLVIMPVVGLASSGLCSAIGAVALNPNPVIRMAAGFLGAALFLPMVATGMHYGLIAIYTVQLNTFGYVTLYPALAMAGAGQVGAAIAIARKAKKAGNSRLCKIINGALPTGILGVGEPLLYGVTIPLGKPFLTAGLGAGFGGAFVTLMEVAATTWGPSGILGIFVMTDGPAGAELSVGYYLIGLGISCVAAYLITALMIKENELKTA